MEPSLAPEGASSGRKRLPHFPSVLCLLFCFVGTHGYGAREAQTQGSELAKLTGIRIVGSQRFSEAEIIKGSGLAVGMSLWARNLQEATNRLLATGVFADVKYRYYIRGSAMKAEFQVVDAANFLPCSFENFVWFSDEELLKELRSRVPLFTGQVPATGNLAERVAVSLQDLLASRKIAGQVRFMPLARLGRSDAMLQFEIEGPVISIYRTEFEGVRQIDVSLLDEASRFLIGKAYGRSFVHDFASRKLADVYLKRGYLQVAFGTPRPQPLPEGGATHQVAVTIPVEEGLQYRLAGIRWAGNTVFPSGDLAKLLHLLPREPVDAVQLQEDLESVQELYGTRGYLFARVGPKPALDDAARAASYDLEVHEGDLYRMGDLTLIGVDAPTARALRERSRLRPGMPFDRSYWKVFLRESVDYLSQRAPGWKVEYQQSVVEATKSVDVTVRFRSPGR